MYRANVARTVRLGRRAHRRFSGSAMPGRRLIGGIGLLALAWYAALKAAWAMGSRIGIEDAAAWDRAFGELTEVQYWAALWGTDLLALAGALVLVAVLADRATPLGRPPVRGVLRSASWLAAALLGLFALAALGSTGVTDLRVSRGEAAPSPMAAWVYYGVYGAFLTYALALIAALVRTRDRRHPRRSAARGRSARTTSAVGAPAAASSAASLTYCSGTARTSH